MSAQNQSEQERARAREDLMLRMIETVDRMFGEDDDGDDDGDDDDDFISQIKELL